MPLRPGRALLLALIGGVATYLSWMSAFAAFWKAHWHRLDRLHDFDLAILITLGPVVVALIFFATICLEAAIEKKSFESGRPPPARTWRILRIGALPAVIMVLLITALLRTAWRAPLSEAVVFVVGLALGAIWVLWRRADEGAAIAWFTTPWRAPVARPASGRAP